ncbi:MAG TPA: carboxypeptidase regulatory-like domain-containing protein, partial [Gemmatimonadales bacterium]|nr:carboxypeptidase regulatory-like domain-containing protein [Gemmatimonadales bacterium]
TAPGGDGDPVVASVTVHGTVVDSVTGQLLPGVNVAIGGKFATTDAQGAFTLPAAPGANTVHATVPGYETFARTFDPIPAAGNEVTLQLPLRRLAPVPVACWVGPEGFQAVIVDLQGRKSLERWQESTLTLVTGTGTRTIPAIDWNYHAVDYLRWGVSIPDASPSTIRADWVLFDSEGDVYRGSCEPAAAPPDTTQA